MSTLVLVSQIALWLVVGCLLLTTFALARQIALIHRRIAPAGARMQHLGPAVGEPLPEFEGRDLFGKAVQLGAGMRNHVLLLFVSPGCSTCSELMPAVLSLSRSERRWLDVVLFDVGAQDEASARAYVERHELQQLPWVPAGDFGERCNVSGSPYALMINREGRVEAKGLVNHLEHLESLLNASRLGHPSLESYMSAHFQET